MQKITAVAREEARLDLLAAQVSGASRSQAARWIEQGLCLVNGTARQKPAFKVAAGDALELTVPDAGEAPVEKEDIPLEILYEDADLPSRVLASVPTARRFLTSTTKRRSASIPSRRR